MEILAFIIIFIFGYLLGSYRMAIRYERKKTLNNLIDEIKTKHPNKGKEILENIKSCKNYKETIKMLLEYK